MDQAYKIRLISANASVLAKLDVTFGDNVDGVGGKAGMRVSW
jgi:hypothetical protein